jgi:glycosyltransferase involved in cell wall biosynthesis
MINIIFNGRLEPKGGPSGYLYNLRESIEKNFIDNIKIISTPSSVEPSNSFKVTLKKILKRKLSFPNWYRERKSLAAYRNLLKNNEKEFESSKILHFHTTTDLYWFSKMYDVSLYTIVLMSHSPEPPYVELYNNLLSRGYSKKFSKKKEQIQKEIDTISFKLADYLIFPCDGAVQPYECFFDEIKLVNPSIKYLLTSSKPIRVNIDKNDFVKKFNIPKDRKIIAYVGRKNTIKGFDIFCEIASIFKNDDDFFFISAGVGDISAPSQDNFLDIGWTDDPGSLVNASDVQIVPNRDTYFDLGIIQALSINTKIITTLTGGNSWFVDKFSDVYFADLNEINSFVKLLSLEEIYFESNKNKKLYDKYFNNKSFALNYNQLYEDILFDCGESIS